MFGFTWLVGFSFERYFLFKNHCSGKVVWNTIGSPEWFQTCDDPVVLLTSSTKEITDICHHI